MPRMPKIPKPHKDEPRTLGELQIAVTYLRKELKKFIAHCKKQDELLGDIEDQIVKIQREAEEAGIDVDKIEVPITLDDFDQYIGE